MAAFNKLGSLLRHSTLTSGAPASSSPALFNAARLMSTKLFVGGLSWGTDEQTLKQAFSSFGEVTEARIITDRETGRSRGFGFVNFSNSDDAKAAVSQMDGQHHAPAPVFFPNADGNAAPWQPEPPSAAVGEDVGELDPEPGLLHAEGADDEEEPVFVLTDEWAEFFAKSDAKRRLGN
ncbi:glycine-rich RNA-binding protein 2, mitochondrial-like [Panicum miliaceum]|uniref:Glycine-rich RNA-binding protein 2, mitochondrial-like n=1 Tax=Panicum miliaceum TaxID=4540 RepID=A0A3L6RLZ9_PANMI|nr:glycine-rich RNA-binding protein 2, mitochondrial-like [Panicum miliaceum]